jgi:pyruvate carboxylase
MSDLDVQLAGAGASWPEGWSATWVDREGGILRIDGDGSAELVVVEGAGTEWFVTVRGRRLPVTVRSWRERVLAEAEVASQAAGGPVDVRATLPGLVVELHVAAGDEVEAGAPLLTIEAMKMQNEVRAPRAGTVAEIAVTGGQPVATGALLLRLA